MEKNSEMLKTSQRKSNAANTTSTAILVSDTSPLIALKHADVLEMLNALFQVVMVPLAVARKLSVKEGKYFASLGFLKLEEPSNKRLVKALRLVVDEGESEAITLALEKNAILLIDDLKGKSSQKLGG